jgi:hypothetical protein
MSIRQYYIQQCAFEENQRWRSNDHRQIAKQYQAVVGIDHIANQYEKHYLKYLRMGYFEPIHLSWTTSACNPLTTKTPGSQFDDGAGMTMKYKYLPRLHLHFPEERLYWILNHSYQHGKPRQAVMRPSESAEVRTQLTVYVLESHLMKNFAARYGVQATTSCQSN